MKLTENINILKFKENNKELKRDTVIKEIPFRIILNNTLISTLMCNPVKLKYLAAGYIISEYSNLSNFKIKIIKEKKTYDAIIESKNSLLIKDNYRINFDKYLNDLINIKPVKSDIKINHKQILSLMKKFQKKSKLFIKTGGVHSSAICDNDKIEVFAEDISRYNAVNKVLGECFIKKIETENKLLLLSCRITAEIIIRIIRGKVPVVISCSAPTDMAIKIGEKTGITVVGFARENKMNVYTHEYRIF